MAEVDLGRGRQRCLEGDGFTLAVGVHGRVRIVGGVQVGVREDGWYGAFIYRCCGDSLYNDLDLVVVRLGCACILIMARLRGLRYLNLHL